MASMYRSHLIPRVLFCVSKNLYEFIRYADNYASKFPKVSHILFSSYSVTPTRNLKVIRSQQTKKRGMYGIDNTFLYYDKFPKKVEDIGVANGLATVKSNMVIHYMTVQEFIKYKHYLGLFEKACYNDFIGYC